MMLTSEIKQKIDSARDILVGKIPTPTGQVEQITLALVYKFMNDIDEQNKELGGELKFFTGEYSKYAWKNLLDKSLSAYDRVTLYGEGLDKMHLNPNLPQFFRNVFKGAFLPFRDPEVLTLFLKQIDEFQYGVNGDLGDAFEYLLQVMGTQGDAGQFLTPRHIINFIVSVVDPQKTDKILDPAVGTAGFLISAYQHLLKQNTLEGSNKLGSALTIDDRKRFANNFVGYDVSHDLVRLSLVNLYLHNFADPKIYEYDTLGNVDRWDDDFDCILTNPPFMTPKGGVKPHKRFSIQAKRSEVLFVDYIMEHLNPNGKAGIIVPEGIIFQSATAYKALRKMMIDQNFLYAVVSLPAGIFQPYSGVKTSILFMDRVLAKKTKDILFGKVENDGFDLGAQRRQIDKNDLPRAAEILKRYKLSIQTGKPFGLSDEDKQLASLVPIEKISKSGDYNLSGDRYREKANTTSQNWPMIAIEEICDLGRGRVINKEYINEHQGIFPVYSSQTTNDGIFGYIDTYDFDGEYATWTTDGANAGTVFYRKGKFNCTNVCGTIKAKNETILMNYLARVLNQIAHQYVIQVGNPKLMNNVVSKIKIPLPPLEVQQEIVSQLDSCQKIIDGAKQVVDNYKPEIKIDPSWVMVELGEVSEVTSSKRIFQEEYVSTGIPFYRTKEIVELSQNKPISLELFISEDKYKEIKDKFDVPEEGDILISAVGTIGISWVVSDSRSFYFKDGNLLWIKNLRNIDPYFLKQVLDNVMNFHLNELIFGAAYNALTIVKLKQVKIPLPPLDIQKQIVARIEEEQQMVDVNKRLIEIYQGKIKEKIDEVWGE